MRLIFACGGTAGHIYPAIAVASRMKELYGEGEILFIGAEGHMETELVPREGYPIETLNITNISRDFTPEGIKHNAETVKNVLISSAKAGRIIKEFRPDAVIGTGGYVCYPVISAAHSLGIPTVVHESNASPGLTTKMLSRKADRILVGYEGCADKYPDSSRVTATGTPVRSEFGRLSRSEARKELGIGENEKLVVSVWGSLGAGFMNAAVCEMIPLMMKGSEEFRLVHATGEQYYEGFCEKLPYSDEELLSRGIEIKKFIHNMPQLMAAADLVMCRAGASTLSELTFMGKPALLVPSPNVTDNHQEKNARVFEKAGAAKVALEDELSPETLLAIISGMLSDEEGLKEMSSCSETLSSKDAADVIARIIGELAGLPEIMV